MTIFFVHCTTILCWQQWYNISTQCHMMTLDSHCSRLHNAGQTTFSFMDWLIMRQKLGSENYFKLISLLMPGLVRRLVCRRMTAEDLLTVMSPGKIAGFNGILDCRLALEFSAASLFQRFAHRWCSGTCLHYFIFSFVRVCNMVSIGTEHAICLHLHEAFMNTSCATANVFAWYDRVYTLSASLFHNVMIPASTSNKENHSMCLMVTLLRRHRNKVRVHQGLCCWYCTWKQDTALCAFFLLETGMQNFSSIAACL